MERKRFSVLFFIKRSKLLKNGEAPVRVRVTYDRLYVELQLKRSVKVPLWSQEKEKSTGKDRNSVELNHYIDALRVKFYQIYQDLELEGKIISARAIVNRYQGKDETFKTLYNVFKEHNDNCRKLIGTDYADITVRRYDNCLKYLMELVKRDYKVDDMLLREVNILSAEIIICLVSLALNVRFIQRMQRLQDNDIKYRYILMKGKADGSSLDLLETKFSRERDNAFIRSLTDSVKGFEYRSRKQAETLERARLLNEQAEQLREKANKLGKP